MSKKQGGRFKNLFNYSFWRSFLRKLLHVIHRFFRPIDAGLFKYFIDMALKGEKIAELLKEMLRNPNQAETLYEQMRLIEKGADSIKADGHKYLRKTSFPIPDHDESQKLLRRLDDVIDTIDSIGRRVMLIAQFNGKIFNVYNTFYELIIEQSDVLHEIVVVLNKAIADLSRLEWNPVIYHQTASLENKGDILWEGKTGVLDQYFTFLADNAAATLSGSNLLMLEWKILSSEIEDCIDIVKNTVDFIHDVTDSHKDLELSITGESSAEEFHY